MMLTVSLVASRTTTSSADLYAFAERANSEVIARIAKSYTLPLSSIPILETITTEIAVQKYLQQRVFMSERRNDSDWPAKFDQAWETLEGIVDGKITLVDSAGNVVEASTTQNETWSNTMNYNPTFREDGFIDSFVDCDKVDDIQDDREESAQL